MYVRDYDKNSIVMVRNFYGGLRVNEEGGPDYATKYRTLFNGTINHGAQFLGRPGGSIRPPTTETVRAPAWRSATDVRRPATSA